MDPFTLELAREARRLELTAGGEDNDPERLLAFATFVLSELAARGLIPDERPAIGCWAAPRSAEN
ncbi:hypothetical protein [Deinococcus sp. PESE-13]